MLQKSSNPALAAETYASSSDDPPEPLYIQRSVEPKFKPPQLDTGSVFAAIDRLEESILNSPRVPLTGKTMVNEEELLEQIDTLRLNLPEIIALAQEIVQSKERLMKEAQQQIQQIVAEANQRAYQVANELGIIDRSEQEAKQIRQMAIAQSEHLRQQTIVEVERLRNYQIQEIERMRDKAMAECQQIQDGADEYADRVLHDMEDRLSDVLQAIKQGRQQLNADYSSSVNFNAQSGN